MTILIKIKKIIVYCICYCFNRFSFFRRDIYYPKSIKLNGLLRLSAAKEAQVSIGENVIINSSWKSNPSGGGQIYTLLCIRKNACLIIGDGVGISNSTIVCSEKVTIGNNVYIGVNCVIYDTDMHSVVYEERMSTPDINSKHAPVTISNGAWICGHCIILKGVMIGERSVIAAGSVVTRNVPADEVWGGNPAVFLKHI